MMELVKEGQKDTVAAYEHNGSLHVATFEFDEISKIDSTNASSSPSTASYGLILFIMRNG